MNKNSEYERLQTRKLNPKWVDVKVSWSDDAFTNYTREERARDLNAVLDAIEEGRTSPFLGLGDSVRGVA